MIHLPNWTVALLRWLAPEGELDDVLGDLEEGHRRRLRHHTRGAAQVFTTFEGLEMSVALIRVRASRALVRGVDIVQDYKLALRMLLKYPGLTIAGGLALAIAIGVGAGWYDLTRDVLRPAIPLPDGKRLVEIEMRNTAGAGDEARLLHDFMSWRRHLQSIADVGAYRTVERNLVLGDARAEPVTIAETTAAAFRIARVPPLSGRPLLESDEQPGALPVVVLGYDVWRQRFGGRADVVGHTVKLGATTTTIVGVMPKDFAFPINHRLWVPLSLRPSGYAPLEGPAIRVFGLLAPGATQAQANVELTTLAERAAVESPQTHQHLRPRVLAYGGQSPGDVTWLEFVVTHLPVLLVLVVACTTVGTLVYARTATREAEIATRHALGAARGRIVAQLFVEALVLASLSAAVGLVVANLVLQWGMELYYSGQSDGPPFWLNAGLKPVTIAYAAALTVAGAILLGVLPALKLTSPHTLEQLRTMGMGGSTLRFGKLWTAAMIAQVALSVVLLPPAYGIAQEAFNDRRIRGAFPTEQYLAVRMEFARDQDSGPAAYAEFARQLERQPGVIAITYADRLPGMAAAVRSAEAEVTPQAQPLFIDGVWTASVGPGFFPAFDVPLLAGRDFGDGDRLAASKSVLVNQAFARRYFGGATPLGRRVRYASTDATKQEPWFEIIGMVADVGMTPTEQGEAPYIFTPASITATAPLVVGVRVAGNPASLAPAIRTIAANLDASIRLDEVRTLDDVVWGVDVPMMVGAGTIAAVVSLGLFLSASGIFALMSVSVARRTREIGLRTALGASRARLLGGVLSHAFLLLGGGIAAGNAVLLLFVSLSDEVAVADIIGALLLTSGVMLTVGLLACMEPARRALRIQPSEALKQA